MRQLLQNVSTGQITVEDVAPPQWEEGRVLVAVRHSLISAGTERAIMDLGKASLVAKARARPDLVRKVVDSARQEGVVAAATKVRARLSEPNALGYSLCGTVLEASDDLDALPGDLVACAGAGLASHAEVVSVPVNLCARVPEGVPSEHAAYATVASIALHGVRLSETGLGDVAAVIGLGLVGQLTMQLLRASGCVAIGFDLNPARAELSVAQGFSAFSDADDFASHMRWVSGGHGADAVLIAAASRSPAPLHMATACVRERANVVLVGDVPIETPRAPLFQKELRLVVSRSYGPGRYDPDYEERGRDYPIGYVRWTEGRNLREVVRLMAAGAVDPGVLTTHTFELGDGPRAYELLEGEEASLGILLHYASSADGTAAPAGRRIEVRPGPLARIAGRRRPRIGVIGAGMFARSVLLPRLAKVADITAVATKTGVSARLSGERYGAALMTTDPRQVIESDVDAVLIATRHDLHGRLAADALRAGKHVYVEKPLALDPAELQTVMDAASAADRVLMVGFNRRFAPLAVALRGALGGRGPVLMTYRINAGRIPAGHWVHDPSEGGGRIVGEVCHFVDLAAYLCGGRPTVVSAHALTGTTEPLEDNVAATLRFADGSLATITYTALGDVSLEKERVELLGEAGAGVLSDFRSLELHRGGERTARKGARNKGHTAALDAFVDACRQGRQPWPVEEIAAVSSATFAIRDRIRGHPALP